MKTLRLLLSALLAASVLSGCGGSGSNGDGDASTDTDTDTDTDSDADSDTDTGPDAGADGGEDGGIPLSCPSDMVLVADVCVDRYEAPNQASAKPLVMFSFIEAEAWCAARGRRLCFDDEWTEACGGADGWAYPYGDVHVDGQCNDDEAWLAYDQDLLNAWPNDVCTVDVTDWDALLDEVRLLSPEAEASADHVAWLYQAELAGDNASCTNAYGAFDMQGNAEEWTRRRDGGEPGFHGRLQGSYWAQVGTCSGGTTAHGDSFRFYETGFRCCWEP